MNVIKGDITALDFDLIVNAANSRLLPGGGVCGAIFAGAGPELVEECREIGYCPTGQAVLTGAGNLPCRGIIHTVGPIYIDGQQGEDQDLKAAYWNSLVLAYDYLRKNDLETLSIGFPCISTGIYGYPRKEACKIAVETVDELMKEYPDARALKVTFVCYEQPDYALYKKELGR